MTSPVNRIFCTIIGYEAIDGRYSYKDYFAKTSTNKTDRHDIIEIIRVNH
jgi:hypothetical protein